MVIYAVNMFYCHWLIKKLLLANDLTEYSQAERDIQNRGRQGKPKLNAGRKKAESWRNHEAFRGDRREPSAGTLLGGHEPCGKI